MAKKKAALLALCLLSLLACDDGNPEKEPYCRHWNVSSLLQHHGAFRVVHVDMHHVTVQDSAGNYMELMLDYQHSFCTADEGTWIR